MKPEHLILLQNYSYLEVYLTRILEMVAITYSRQENGTEEMANAFHKMLADETHKEYETHLRKMINTFQTVFGESSSGGGIGAGDLSVEEYLKKLFGKNGKDS